MLSESETWPKKDEDMIRLERNYARMVRWTVTYSDRSRDQYTSLGTQTLVPKNTFQVFFFSVYFNKKYVEVKINDFTLYITILHAANMVYSKVSNFYFLAPRLSFY